MYWPEGWFCAKWILPAIAILSSPELSVVFWRLGCGIDSVVLRWFEPDFMDVCVGEWL